MKRVLIAALKLPTLILPLVFAATAMQPLAGPGLRAMSSADCRLKAKFEDGSIHCHEEGTNCVITCPAET